MAVIIKSNLRCSNEDHLVASVRAFRLENVKIMTSEIIASLPQKYEVALKSGDLLFFPSTIAKCTETDVDVRPEAST